tara:strand:+ start:584 stop:2647 length:2064 start_codon:yes stop_codon:yes gene_type:complete
MPGQFESILDKLQRKLGKQTIRKASTIARPKPKPEVVEMNLFNEFMKRNPKADGGSVNGSEQAAFRAKVEELMDDGYDFGEAVREAMRQGYQDGGRIGFLKAGLVKGGSRTAPEFRGKYGVRTAVTVPENTPGYLGRSGEQVIFNTKADAERFIKEDAADLRQAAQESKKRSPVIEARLQKIRDFVKAEKKAGKKTIYLDDIIDHLQGEKTVFGTGKRGIQTEQTEIKSRTNLKINIKEALGKKVYDSLIKSQATDPRKLDAKKAKFNKLILDINAGRLPITALGSEARGTKTNIKQYLTKANKKRFDKLLPKLRAINSRITQPASTTTPKAIEELKKTTNKNFKAMMKKYPSSIERRTNVFKGGARFYDAKSYALALIGRHVGQGGKLYKHVGGDTMKDVKFRNNKTGKLITIRNMDMNSPEFKEAGDTYKDFEKLKNSLIDNPLTGEKISLNNAIKQGSDGKDYLIIDHTKGIKNRPLNDLIITTQKQNIGFELAGLSDEEKKRFYRKKLDYKTNLDRFKKYGERLLLGSKYKKPTKTIEEFRQAKPTTVVDKAGNIYRSVRPTIDAFTTMFPGRIDNAMAAAIDFPMMYMSGAPLTQAAGSAASMFMNNPNLGKAINIGLEQAALSDEEKFLQRATQRREGIESALKSVPSRFQSFIERNRGPADESFTSYFDGGIVSALKGVK